MKKEDELGVLAKILEWYESISGKKILEALKKFEFNHEAKTFERACLEKAVQYLEQKGTITNEEFLALLVRLCIMHFVQKKHYQSLWYVILSNLLPKEIQEAKISEVVKKFEEQFIESMEIIEKLQGDEGIRDAVLVFLFKENADFVFTVFNSAEMIVENLKKILH
jgi:uncharacterized protein (UPF0332 family)